MAFAISAGAVIRTVTTTIEEGFALPKVEKFEELITERTKAICIVHLYGRCAMTDKIAELCERYQLRLVEDNAQAHGCKFQPFASSL